MNTFGNIYRLTSFGESHGAAVGGVVDGMPAGVPIDVDYIQRALDRRRPGQSAFTTPRREADRVELLSGVMDGLSTGMPIGFLVRNENQRPRDYSELRDVYRPSHADFTYQQKYGLRDYRGGGRQSARETIARVVGGALASLVLRSHGIEIRAYTSQIGRASMEGGYRWYDEEAIESSVVRCPEPEKSREMEDEVKAALKDGDSVGGVVSCIIRGCPVGLGEPVFGKFHAALAAAEMSVNAVRGFEIGEGFRSSAMRGSAFNDPFVSDPDGRIHTATNHNGGVLGGITDGEDVTFRVAFKPVPTIRHEQDTVDLSGHSVRLSAHGRHDPCVVARAVPIVEAMAAMVTLDYLLLSRTVRP